MSDTPDSYADCLIKLGEAIKEQDVLRKMLEEGYEDNKILREAFELKTKKLVATAKQLNTTSTLLDGAKKELAKRNQECNDHVECLTALREELKGLRGQVQNLESNLSRQQGENSSLKTDKAHLEVANTDLKNRCGNLRKDANRAKDISASESTMTIGEIAAFRSISAVRMNRFLQTHGLISKTNNTWVPSATAMEMGLARMTAVTYRRKDRTKKATKNFCRWTEKGREHILHLYDTYRVEAQSA
jgi:phage antirepressor YoqD-like protein